MKKMTVYPQKIDQAVYKSMTDEPWIVHSIFVNSLNLKQPTSDTLLLITTENYPLMPQGMYLKTSDFAWLKQQLQVNDKFYVKNHSFIHDQAEIHCGYTATYSLNIKQQLPIVDQNVQSLLHYCQTLPQLTGFDISLADLFIKSHPFTQAVQDLCKTEHTKQLQGLNYLLGRGKGLTPSGDDVIIGFLAAQTILMNTGDHSGNNLLHQLLLQEQKTTDVSRHYLVCALNQIFSQPIIQLLEELTKQNTELLEQKVQQILSFGHTSGADTLAGFVLTLYYYKIGGYLWHKE